MNDFYFNEDFDFLEIEVSEKIEDSNLKKFLNTTLKLHNKNLSKKDKIYLIFLEQLNQYQIYILKFPYKSFEFLVFETFYENKIVENTYDLYICDEFFCLYKNGLFFYLQKIKLDLDLNINEVILFLNKKFNIEINNSKIISKEELIELKQNYQKKNKKIKLTNIDINNNFVFKFYIYYLIILIIISFLLFFNFDKKIQEEENTNFLFDEIKKEYAYKSLHKEIDFIFQSIKKYDLSIVSFELIGYEAKIIVNALSKSSIYLFLKENEKTIFDSAVNYFEDKATYEVVLNVRISK